jgi:sec-independent protein translocase protein TatB
MFDVGFFELVLIGLVALIVIGPERLPRVARAAGLWIGRARRTFTAVKDEIDRELRAEELKEILRKQADSESLERIIESPPKPGRTRAEASEPEPTERPATPDGTAHRSDPP